MRAVRIHEDGGPEVLVLEEAPDPEPGPGEVLVRLHASALNHLDVWIRKGLPSVPKPRILGADGAGVVEALGDGVSGFEVGERVVLNPGIEAGGGRIHVIGEHGDGTNAELIAVPATNVHPIPDGLSFEEAAAFPLVFETAYRMLVTRAGLREGEWVLAWGIGGGVSTAALAIAKALGARVLVTSSSDAKLERARELGADATVNHATGDVKAAVQEATDGHGIDVVVENVGEATWATSLQVAAPGGRITVCGATTGPNPPAALHRIWWKQLSILGSTMGTGEDFAGAYELVASGRALPGRRLGAAARGDPRRARAARGRRAARQDRPHDLMPFQNRVTPFGELIATPERGLVYGNRGRLHDEHGVIRRRLAGEAVDLLPAGVPRPLPGRWADGAEPLHGSLLPRRGDRARRRAPAVRRVPERGLPQLPRAHGRGRRRRARRAAARGTRAPARVGAGRSPRRRVRGARRTSRGSSSARQLLRWTPGGYSERRPRFSGRASVVTPPTSVRVLASGWNGSLPLVHPSRQA